MRTTLTLDPDVAAILIRLLKARKTSLKELVNEALRRGLQLLTAPQPNRKPFVTRAADLGPCLLGSIDDVTEALAIAEGDNFK